MGPETAPRPAVRPPRGVRKAGKGEELPCLERRPGDPPEEFQSSRQSVKPKMVELQQLKEEGREAGRSPFVKGEGGKVLMAEPLALSAAEDRSATSAQDRRMSRLSIWRCFGRADRFAGDPHTAK